MQEKISDRLEKLGKSLSQLREDNGIPKPGDILFSSVKGYQQTSPPLKSIKAAHNLWATLDYAFVSSTSWDLLKNTTSVKNFLFASAQSLQEGEMVTDEATARLAKIWQEFFNNANKLEKKNLDTLSWSLGGNAVEIFNLLSVTFNMAEHRYKLGQLRQQLTDLEKQITNSLTPLDPEQLDRLRQIAVSLLPNNQQLNLTGNVDEVFVRDYKKQWDGYIQSISTLNTNCLKSKDLASFETKFLNERKTCITFINDLNKRLNDLPAKLAAQQKKIEEEKAKQAQPSESLPEQPVQEEKLSVSPPITSAAVGFPEILSLQEQIALLKSQLITAKNEWKSLKDKQTSLEAERTQLTQSLSKSKNPGEEREEVTKQLSKITQLKDEINGDKLNNNATTNKSTLALLNTDEETLKIYLQQQAEKTGWIAWGWGAPRRTWQWARGTTSLPYLDQQKQFIQTLEGKITSETEKQIQLAETIKQREADEARLTQLNNELAALTTLLEKQEALQTDLKGKKTKLQVTLQQIQEEYFNNAKQALMDSMRTAIITTYEDSSMPSTPSGADLPEITKLQQEGSSILNAELQQTDLPLPQKEKTLEEKKKEKLEAAESYLKSLLKSL